MASLPTGPAGWRQLGLLTLLALIAVLLMARGCAPEATPASGSAGRVWQPAVSVTWVADLFRTGPVEGAPNWQAAARRVVGGDPGRGRTLAKQYGCGACHRAEDIGLARGGVGPDLHGFANRGYIAGILSNTPGALVAWLQDPPAHAPRTAMPDMNIPERDARDLAAWLYSLAPT